MAEGTPPAECTFTQDGVFHFQIEFYEDVLLNTLKFSDRSEDNPKHFFVNGVQMTGDGLTASVDVCYAMTYRPDKSFLGKNELLDQVLYVRFEALVQSVLA
jgi:hypothetical protein